MHPAPPPAPSRRTLLRGAAVTALTAVAFLSTAPPQPAAAAAPDKPEPHPHKAKAHPHASIIGLL
ncbi:hypothetical protein [Streptomyces justiciae]|uniref:hypothetical protein n=1 Tax=Streptomyces justiciae TaxID=2780140 RepID=UPI00188131AE|nr:hypothetical protein [Streptomyces justiciae]MBE8472133.1 hypothetical protein [Streptomyces justiciae]MCW8375985.1 hypothetical protein [Streptomyces justiciae]